MRTYRGIYSRFLQVGEDVDFAQVVVSQQTLFDALRNYVDALSEQWQSAVEVAEIVQIDALFSMGQVIGHPNLATPPMSE